MTKISIITWDFGFRESHHSLHSLSSCFKESNNDIEIILAGYVMPDAHLMQTCAWNSVRHVIANQSPYHPGKLLNIGASQARGDYLLFCDADLIFPDEISAFAREVVETGAIGLAHRVDMRRFKDRFWETDRYKDCLRNTKTTTIKKKLNNYAPLVMISKAHFGDIGGFSESPVFATMTSKFCKDLVKRGERIADTKIFFLPLLHGWHPTPRSNLTKGEAVEIKNRLRLQEILIRLGGGKIREAAERVVGYIFKRKIDTFNIKWGKP